MAEEVLGILTARKPITTITGSKIAIQMDAVLTRQHDIEALVTEFPVESGATITDHRRKLPRRLTLVCFLSDHPVSISASFRQLPDNALANLTAGANLTPATTTVATRSRTAMAALEAAHEEGALLTVVTRIAMYKNMAIESISVPESNDIGQAVEFTLTLKEILKVSLLTASLTESIKVTTADIAQPRAARGRQAGKVAPASATTRATTFSNVGAF